MNEQTRGYNFDDDNAFQDPVNTENTETVVEDAQAEIPPETEIKAKSGKMYYIMIGVVVLVALFLFYHMFFGGNKPQPAPAQNPNFGLQVTPSSSFSSNTTASQAPAGSGNYIMVQKQDIQAMVDGFTQIANKNAQAMADQVGKLQAAVTASMQNTDANRQQIIILEQQLQQLNSKFDSYNQNLTQISKALHDTQSQMQLILAQTAQNATQLSLRAVVPGRAWLVDSKGVTSTVTVGTILPYYGKVTSIDADAGTVTMSSGYVFQ